MGIAIGYDAGFTNRSGSTSGSSNTWTQIAAARADGGERIGWFVQNASDTAIEVGFGDAASEVAVISLAAGASTGEQYPQPVYQGRIAVRCPAATGKAYLAHEK